MDRNSKIYVAGHRGLVGSAIMRKLREENYLNLITRTSAELDLRRQADTERFFEMERPDYVYLAAAKVGGILANSTYKAEFIYDNLTIASNVIHSAYKYGVKKLLNLGSSCIYPKFTPQPMKEEHLLTGLLEPTNEPYALAKIAAIKLCRYYNEQYGTNFISVMPTNLYGIGDSFDLKNSHVLPALIRKMYLGKCLHEGDLKTIHKDLLKQGGEIVIRNSGFVLNRDTREEDILKILEFYGVRFTDRESRNTAVALWGTGEPYREFLYVDDVANACVFLMNEVDSVRIAKEGLGTADTFINIGAGEDLTIRELADIVRDVVGYKGEIVWDTSKPDGTQRKLLDVSKIMSLGWRPKISLKEGVRRTYEWYVAKT